MSACVAIDAFIALRVIAKVMDTGETSFICATFMMFALHEREPLSDRRSEQELNWSRIGFSKASGFVPF